MSMKKVVNCWYTHKSNREELYSKAEETFGEDVKYIISMTNWADDHINYEIMKLDTKKKTISFIDSPDWFTAYEPVVGDSVIVSLITGEVKETNGRTRNKQIYHSKELFMPDDYDPLWMEAARRRTKLWSSIPGIEKLKSRIGNQDFWFEILDANGIEKTMKGGE